MNIKIGSLTGGSFSSFESCVQGVLLQLFIPLVNQTSKAPNLSLQSQEVVLANLACLENSDLFSRKGKAG